MSGARPGWRSRHPDWLGGRVPFAGAEIPVYRLADRAGRPGRRGGAVPFGHQDPAGDADPGRGLEPHHGSGAGRGHPAPLCHRLRDRGRDGRAGRADDRADHRGLDRHGQRDHHRRLRGDHHRRHRLDQRRADRRADRRRDRHAGAELSGRAARGLHVATNMPRPPHPR